MRLDEGSASTRHGCFAQTDESCASSTRSERIRARIFSSTFNGQPAIRSRSPCFGAFCVRMRFGACARRVSACARDHPLLCAARTSCQPIVTRRRHRVGAASAGRPQQMRRTRPLAAVRRVAHRRVSRALPHVCRVAQPRAELASGLPRELHRRIIARARGASGQGTGSVGGAAGNRAARAHGLSRRKPRCAAVQRPPVFPGTIADRRIVCRGRRGRAQGAARVVDDESGPTAEAYAKAEARHYVRSARRTRIDYRDLGVEQLGAVYESVLDYEPAYADSRRNQILLRRGGDARKSTGSFYTPQTLTDYVVRRTLHPLVDGAPADRILQLRVVDPAMGSAAFLVSACRYLARAYERALVREGLTDEADIDDADRALFRRLVAQRCLFGVDLNPTAVQLARLSLWLATLSANKPLTFLDHHLVCGNSLIGASPIDMARQPPGAAIAAAHESLRNAPLLRRRPRTLARSCRRRATLARGHPG